jgi:hypothetical protein
MEWLKGRGWLECGDYRVRHNARGYDLWYAGDALPHSVLAKELLTLKAAEDIAKKHSAEIPR